MSVDKLLMTKRNILNLKTIIKDSTDVLPFSIIEIFSGDVRIDTGQTDFDGIDIFVISSGSIIDNKILIKIYGIKCEVFENEYMINDFSQFSLKVGKLFYKKSKYYFRNMFNRIIRIYY